MSGKKSSSGKNSSTSVMKSAVAQKRSLKNLIAALPYKITSVAASEAYCPGSQCTPQDRMEKTLIGAKLWN
jgi:hypothetical protein